MSSDQHKDPTAKSIPIPTILPCWSVNKQLFVVAFAKYWPRLENASRQIFIQDILPRVTFKTHTAVSNHKLYSYFKGSGSSFLGLLAMTCVWPYTEINNLQAIKDFQAAHQEHVRILQTVETRVKPSILDAEPQDRLSVDWGNYEEISRGSDGSTPGNARSPDHASSASPEKDSPSPKIPAWVTQASEMAANLEAIRDLQSYIPESFEKALSDFDKTVHHTFVGELIMNEQLNAATQLAEMVKSLDRPVRVFLEKAKDAQVENARQAGELLVLVKTALENPFQDIPATPDPQHFASLMFPVLELAIRQVLEAQIHAPANDDLSHVLKSIADLFNAIKDRNIGLHFAKNENSRYFETPDRAAEIRGLVSVLPGNAAERFLAVSDVKFSLIRGMIIEMRSVMATLPAQLHDLMKSHLSNAVQDIQTVLDSANEDMRPPSQSMISADHLNVALRQNVDSLTTALHNALLPLQKHDF